MGRKTIFLIILFTTLSLIGLVGIQLYWVLNAMKVREDNFGNSVTTSISNVIYKMEKLEVINEIQRTMYNIEGRDLMSTIDTGRNLYIHELEMLSSRNIADSLYYKDTADFKLQYLEDIDKAMVFNYDTSFLSVLTTRFKKINSRIYTGDSIDEQKTSAQLENRQKKRLKTLIRQKNSLVNEVIDDMFNPARRNAIKHSINFALVDSLIGAELANQGINLDYEFGIYSPRKGLMLMEKTGKYHKELIKEYIKKSYALNLFPKEVLRYPEFLVVYFPHERGYLLAQMLGILAISLILILSVIVLFTYIIFTILKQKKLSEMKNDFINNMTHEFKTPIATVSLACEALSDKDVVASEALCQSYIQIISEENHRLGSMAERILQTAVLENGQVKLKSDPVDVHHIIEDVIKNIHLQVEAKSGQIVTILEAENFNILADRVHLTNVIFNLVDNAMKYSTDKPFITIQTKNTAEGIEIAISDNGIGITKANQKRIFEKLFRVSTGNIHDVKGFGLGLSYVRFILERHGGTIHVDSEIGKGSCFTLRLPFEMKHKFQDNNAQADSFIKHIFPWKN